ncbi:TFIIH/NER complex subunit [Puccinia graminis f. sp. tritici]|nr:TFIIH/NER complex subunit [Puccinia graminis f. sp. tritici]
MTLDAYNNYLEEVEDITFNLINGVDVAETEAKIKRFQIENQELIAQNAVHEARQAELSKRQEEAIKKEREERKAELLRLEEEARREEEEIKRATIRSLETSNVSAEKLVARQRAVAQKRATARTLASELATKTTVTMPSLGGLIDPSSMDNEETNRPDIEGELGQWDDYSSMFDLKRLDANLQPGYIDHESMRLVMNDHALALVGGFEIESVWERQLRSAMMGLFVPPPEAGGINQTTSDDLSLHNLTG